jgi:drug/metabolite transporter (DMT)-like permease
MAHRKPHLDLLAVGLLVCCCLFWGFQQTLVKATLPEVAPVFQAALRFLGATLILWLWCRWRAIPLTTSDGTLWPGMLAGFLFALEFACLYTGLQFTSASRLTVLLYTSPFWVALLLPIWVRSERLGALQWLGLVIAFGALSITVGQGISSSNGDRLQWLGDALALTAGLAWGLTTITIRASSLVRISAEKLLFYQVAFSALTLPVLSLLLGEHWSFDFSPFAATSLILQTGVGAFASYLVWMWMLGRYPATRISVFIFLTPIFALMFGSLWLKEPVTPSLLVALASVAVGIVLVNRKSV